MKNTNKIISIIIFLSVSIMLVSCGKQKAAWKGTIEEEEGVTVVKNPKEPIYDEGMISLKEDLSIGYVYTLARNESGYSRALRLKIIEH